MKLQVFNVLLIFWLAEGKDAAVETLICEHVLTWKTPYKADTRAPTAAVLIDSVWGVLLCWEGHLGSV